MRVVCLDSGSYHLTVGKIYDVVYIDKCGYIIINDIGYRHYIEENLFITLSELRLKKLNDIGI